MQGVTQQLHNHSIRLGTLEARDVAGPSQSQMETLVLTAFQKHSKKIDKLVNDKLTAVDEKFSGKMNQHHHAQPQRENKSAAHKALGAAVDNVRPDNVKGHSEGAATHCTDSGESQERIEKKKPETGQTNERGMTEKEDDSGY